MARDERGALTIDEEPLAALAVEVWRLRGRLGRLRELVDGRELRPLEATVAKMEEVLRGAGVEIDDPQGRPYHDGELLQVLLFEPSPGLERPMVLQTVKPAIRLGGRGFKPAEVIVGTPAEAPAPESK